MERTDSNSKTSTQMEVSTSKKTMKAMQWLLLVASILVISVGVSLYVLTEQTETTFSWTISVPLTAAFLGAGYWASFLLELLASREKVWANARIAVPAVLIFTTLTLFVTLLHLDRFHFNAPQAITVLGTWVWLGVYVSVPVAMSIILVLQMRTSGSEPQRIAPLPTWVRAVLATQATIMILLGIGFFFIPQTFNPLWPWELTPLTGRAVGAWLVGLGIAAGHAAYENDWTRIFPMMASYTLYATLVLIALARYPDSPGLVWSGGKTIIFVIFVLTILLIGGYGSMNAWRVRKQKAQV